MLSCAPCPALQRLRQSRGTVTLLVFISLVLENMLFSAVIPIIPNVLRKLDGVNKDVTTVTMRCQNTTAACANGQLTYFSDVNVLEDGDFPHDALQNNSVKVNSTVQKTSGMTYVSQTSKHEESFKIGLLVGSKAGVQLITNQLMGPLTSRIGYSLPMFFGLCITLATTILFALGQTYAVLLAAQALQGVGSTCVRISGLSMIAAVSIDDKGRQKHMNIAQSGIGLGAALGFPFGGILYTLGGKELPLGILAGITCLAVFFQLLAMEVKVQPHKQDSTSYLTLWRDPYILVGVGALLLGNFVMGMILSTVPVRMLRTMDAKQWQQGAIFLPLSIVFTIAALLTGRLVEKIGRWLTAILGLVLTGASVVLIPLCKTSYELMCPLLGFGVAQGLLDSSMFPEMAHLVDLRHTSVYGAVYAVTDVSFCLGFGLGPLISGALVDTIGFKTLYFIVATLTFLYAPLLMFLRNTPSRDEQKGITKIQEENVGGRDKQSTTPFKYNTMDLDSH